jgi:hypothetical protein
VNEVAATAIDSIAVGSAACALLVWSIGIWQWTTGKQFRIRWPRGKYNGRRITGGSVKLTFDTELFYFRPRASWGYGQPYFCWLGFRIGAEAQYGYRDEE